MRLLRKGPISRGFKVLFVFSICFYFMFPYLVSGEDTEEAAKTNSDASKVVEEGTVQKIVKREISLPVGENAPSGKVHRGIQVDLLKPSNNLEDLMSPIHPGAF